MRVMKVVKRWGAVLIAAAAAWTASGCATIPEEAKTHAAALGTCAAKTSQGTLGAYDAVCTTYETVGGRLIEQLATLAGNYQENMSEAAERSEAEAASVKKAAEDARKLATTANPSQADLAALAASLEAIRDRLGKLSSDCGEVAKQAGERNKVVTGYGAGLQAQLTSARELRTVIEQGMLTLEEGIELHRSLFESYDHVRLSRNDFLGAQIAKSFDSAQTEARDVLTKSAGIADKVHNAAATFPTK